LLRRSPCCTTLLLLLLLLSVLLPLQGPSRSAQLLLL
jgi:hypothetical protein